MRPTLSLPRNNVSFASRNRNDYTGSHTLLDRGVITTSESPWAVPVLCAQKKDGTFRLLVDWRKLNSHLVLHSDRFGDIASLLGRFRKKHHITQVDLVPGYTQVTITEADRHKTTFRDAHGRSYKYIRVGFGLTALPAAFSRIGKRVPGNPHPDIVSWPDDILISNYTWQEHISTLAEVLTKLSNTLLLVNYGKCRLAASSQDFLGMIFDATGMKHADSKVEAIANMPEPAKAKKLRSLLGRTGYLRKLCRGPAS